MGASAFVMSKADVLQLVQDLATNQADATAIDRFYVDVIKDLGQREWLVQASLVAVTAGTAEYEPPTGTVHILQVYYDNRALAYTDLLQIEALNPQWRDDRGTPVAFVVETKDGKKFDLFPKPTVNSKDFVFVFGEPLGLDFSEYAVMVVHTETREDLPLWLEMPVAFEILKREFSHESDHQDLEFAKVCGELSALMFNLVS